MPEIPVGAAAPWQAADYARHSSLQEAMASEVLALLQLSGSEHVLDVGCGDGRLTARIADCLPRGDILGVDASADMIAFAVVSFGSSAAYPRDNLRFEVVDARALPYRDAYDLVLSFNALHWVPEQAHALRGIAAALRPSGRAQLRLVVKGEQTSLEEIAEAVRRKPRWVEHFRGFSDPYLRLTGAEYGALATREGLQILAQETHLRSWDFTSHEAFFGFCRAGFGAWTRRLNPAAADAFVQDVISSYRGALAATGPLANVFHFYQMDIVLSKAGIAADELPARP